MHSKKRKGRRKMGIDLSKLAEEGLDTQAGLSYTGNADKYVSALQRFFRNYEKNRSKVEEFYAAKDYENYMITVHALKSNAKMIGATSLSGSFETLEAAARSNDTAIIDELTTPIMADYAALIEKLRPIGEMGDVRAADEISADEAKEIAEKLLEALDDFDDNTAKRLAKKLSGYPFRMTQADRLKEAIGLIEDFVYEEAADIIREIIPAIE